MPDSPAVIAVNYHRIGAIDTANPFHRLHTVDAGVFAQQVDWMQRHGAVISLDQVRSGRELAELNFVVCFDDVPVSARRGIDLLRERGLPVTISPCGHLAEHGAGTRDKVYAIEQLAPAEAIRAHLAGLLPSAGENASFYHLTKSAELNPHWVRTELIDPLFSTIEAQAQPLLAQRGYLAWPELRELAADELVTVANHTLTHDNLAALSRSALEEEITRSHALFTERMGFPARYFTVPFGRFTPELALDCLQVLTAADYAGILWVGPAGLTVTGPYRHQVLNLSRLHSASTLEDFTAHVARARRASTAALIWQLAPTRHRRPVTIGSSRDAHRARVTEMVLRQGKDYASDPAFYAYQFTDNPYRSERPDYYTVECDGRIEATAYNFHTVFAVDGTCVPGVYLSSWRKLPHAHPAAAAHLLHTMLTREPIVGVYRPNPAIAAAFSGWHRARVQHLTLPVPAGHPRGPRPPYQVGEHADFPESWVELCATSVRRAGFTVARDATYHRWRHSSYPLARATYLTLERAKEPLALAVMLHRPGAVEIADFHVAAAATTAVAPLIEAVLACAARHGAPTVTWQASDPYLVATAVGVFGATATPFDNFYHLNPALLGPLGVAAGELGRRWPLLPLHETGTTSDVLLR
ncbi:UNVERIFIED_ORG: peptidoglycan/xylan/chitin deacetylase (PgdA/CDA1 family) [Microbispora rosea subsp. rosea]